MVEVRYTKTRWTTFLRFHFLLEGTSVFAFVVAMVFMFLRSIFFGLQYALLASMHSGPIVSVYMLLQILSLARFNEQILRCRATTRSNTMYRLISQFEGDLQFRVLGVTITHNKIRAVMTSVVISACSKSVVALVTWLPWAVQKKQCKKGVVIFYDQRTLPCRQVALIKLYWGTWIILLGHRFGGWLLYCSMYIVIFCGDLSPNGMWICLVFMGVPVKCG